MDKLRAVLAYLNDPTKRGGTVWWATATELLWSLGKDIHHGQKPNPWTVAALLLMAGVSGAATLLGGAKPSDAK